ncbi:hypothetical protein GY15_12900 [Delftia sp. 670]|nr:hypothetical protein GY15_12900 [Delftia sp. 670]
MAVGADGEFGLLDVPACGLDAALFYGAVLAAEIDQRAAAAGRCAVHPHQHSARAGACHVHRKGQHLLAVGAIGRGQVLQLALEDGFIEPARTRHVLHMDLEPDDGIGVHEDSFLGD